MSKALVKESPETMELLAAYDPATFQFLAGAEGLRVEQLARDPLAHAPLEQEVDLIATSMNEDLQQPLARLNHRQIQLKQIAHNYGYCVTRI